MSVPTPKELDAKLSAARKALKPSDSVELQGGTVKSARFYHSSISRHNAIIFVLEDGTEVFKALRETDDMLQVASAFTQAAGLTVWYDKNNLVQQFVLHHEYA